MFSQKAIFALGDVLLFSTKSRLILGYSQFGILLPYHLYLTWTVWLSMALSHDRSCDSLE